MEFENRNHRKTDIVKDIISLYVEVMVSRVSSDEALSSTVSMSSISVYRCCLFIWEK